MLPSLYIIVFKRGDKLTVLAYVFLTVRKGGEANVAEKIKNLKGVIDVSELYGEYDIIAKIQKKDMEDLQKFLTTELRSINGVEQSSTMIATN